MSEYIESKHTYKVNVEEHPELALELSELLEKKLVDVVKSLLGTYRFDRKLSKEIVLVLVKAYA